MESVNRVNEELLDAADKAISWIQAISDDELIEQLENCDDTIAYAVTGTRHERV